MSSKTIIRSRFIPKSPMERSHKFTEFGIINKITDHGILITRRDTKTKFWVNTDYYVAKNEISMADTYEEGKEVKLTLIFNCFVNKKDEFSVNIHLADIEPADSMEGYSFGIQNPNPVINVNVHTITETQVPGLYVLTGQRVDEEGKEVERYIFKYFSKDNAKPSTGNYQVTFKLALSSKIILTTGEIFNDFEEYNINVDGVSTTRRSPVYITSLDVVELE